MRQECRYRVREAMAPMDGLPYKALRRVWWIWDARTERTVGEWFPTYTDAARHARVLNAYSILLPETDATDA